MSSSALSTQHSALPTPSPALRTKAVGAYLGLAVGDALGATLEFMTPREIENQYDVHREMIGGGWLRLRKGQVTDDTEMSLALGEAILAHRAVEPEAAAQAFSDWMRRKPIDIGNTVRRGIVHFRTTGEASVPESEYGAGNGAAMRCLPVALFTFGTTPEAVEAATLAQARTTHNNPLSDAGTICVVRMIQAGLAGGSLSDLRRLADGLVAAHPQFRFDAKPQQNPSGFIVDSLKAVFQALFDRLDFETGLIEVVNRGGDSDTTGAIFGMIAGALYGLEAIPKRWIDALEAVPRQACEAQAVALIECG